MKETKRKSFYYPEIPVFLIGIPFISAFNYFLTYSNIRPNLFLLITFTIDTVQGYLAWLAVRLLIIYLDKRIPYSPKPFRRIGIQILTTTLLGLFIIASSTELVSWVAKSKPAPLSFYTVDLLIISIWFWVINGFYIGIYFYRQWENLVQEKQKTQIEKPGILVKKGNQSLLVKFEDIFLFTINTDYVQLTDREGRKFLLDQSLDKIEKQLPPTDFLRVNRKYILHRQIIKGFQRIENGKLLVSIIFPTDSPAELTVSRTKAPTFKQWFLPQ